MNLDEIAIVSGIGCTGRVAGYMNLTRSHHARPRDSLCHRAQAGQPKLKVVVYSATAI